MSTKSSRAASPDIRFLGGTIIIALWSLAFALAAACALEFGGISRGISQQWFSSTESLPLHRTDYYGTPLKQSPYDAFTIQHLHPFYLFSLPWRDADRQAANNNFVHVDESGFRINPNLATAGANRAVLLGGSAAFGHHSSSDSGALAAVLTSKTGIGFINRNAPSWNSHQELVALAKYPDEYILSASFSFSNDVSIFCDAEDPAVIVGTPESFDHLERYFNDIRGAPLAGYFEDFSMKPERLFPDTARLAGQLKKSVVGASQKKRKGARRGARCKDEDVTPVVQAFLRNQMALGQLSKARGAVHIVVIQPSYPLHATSNPDYWTRSDAEYDFRRRAIVQLMTSAFCKEHCYDLSTLFDRLGTISHIKENIGKVYVPRIFADDVHLTDLGVDLVAGELAKIIARLPLKIHLGSNQSSAN